MKLLPQHLLFGAMACLSFMQTVVAEGKVVRDSLYTNSFIEKADFYSWAPPGSPKAVLLLCPGKNGNGETWIREAKWQDFAAKHQLMLCGLSFVSRQNFPLPDYSNAHTESGPMVLEGLKRAGAEGLPILLYGFSAGARFTASFVERYPDKVLAWSACAVGVWVPGSEDDWRPSGIVASGEFDAGCYWSSLQYFQQGRRRNRDWIWVSIPEVGHQRSTRLEDFTRAFFAFKMNPSLSVGKKARVEWRDIDTKYLVSENELQKQPAFATCLPEPKLAELWMRLHHP